ncbi:MAG: hypothetical protein LQ350_001678 [Teloschistes chrysophthalmus]|nr:MAG: hypothetical protein LQ350_001678 [Niorma chrysophthalma]
MASDVATRPVNGNYGPQNPYASSEQQASSRELGTSAGAPPSAPTTSEAANAPNASTGTPATSGEASSSPSKDEVGWYFVEQYYTTLSKNPEKLHLFYNKRSQFLSGVEAEKVSVSVGQRVSESLIVHPPVTDFGQAINERIKELDIQDCKVRVSNVDSQESFKNIVVQVIGEMSNKAAPHRKFVQTFVLAEQPNGYFVLNDIFRYIEDEEEDFEPEEPQAIHAAETEEPTATLTSSDDQAQQQHDAEVVDNKLEAELENEKVASEEPAASEPMSNGTATGDNVGESAEEATDNLASSADEHAETKIEDAEQVVEEVKAEPEKPKDPDPTPIASPPKPAQAEPAQASTPAVPPKPAAPKTWANLVAANRVTAPAAPSSASSASPAPSQSKNVPSSTAHTMTSPATATDDSQIRPQTNGNAGWQTAGTDNNRRQARGQSISGNTEKETVLGYVKNVTEKVDASILKSTLSAFGKLAYFDVSRGKNCAFVEFETNEGYNAAVAANPHSIGGEQIYVEERRPRPAAYGGFNARGGIRGGRGGGDGRPGSQGRGNFPKDGGRGGFVPRGGRGGMTPRGGRGQPMPA